MQTAALYINGILVPVSPDFAVRLNRQFINPEETASKDAQFSYAISIPRSPQADAALRYVGVEEVRGKFNKLHEAELIVGGFQVFEGSFRLASVNAGEYRGNLVVVSLPEVRDIFGDQTLRDLPEWRIDFEDFATSISGYNQHPNPPAIFPFVLYGLLPKVPQSKNSDSYTARTLWDSTVRVGMQDLPPSVRPLDLIRKAFESKGLQIGGTAFEHPALANLFQSYKVDEGTTQPWNYGYHAKVNLSGSWSSRYDRKQSGNVQALERGLFESYDNGQTVYGCDFLDSTNSNVQVLQDPGGNVLMRSIPGGGRSWTSGQIRIPASGFYKVRLFGSVVVENVENWRTTDPNTGIQHIGGETSNAVNDLNNKKYEIKLLRDFGQGGDFGLDSARLGGRFYFDNFAQNTTFDADNVPKYFPKEVAGVQVQMVDPAQDRNVVLGVSLGSDGGETSNPRGPAHRGTLLAAKPAQSWDGAARLDKATKLAVQSPGFWKYGRLGAFDNPDDNPDGPVDWDEAEILDDVKIGTQGETIPGDPGDAVMWRFALESNYTYYIEADEIEGVAFLHNSAVDGAAPVQSVVFIGGQAAIVTTGVSTPFLTLQIRTADFDAEPTLSITRVINETSEDAIGWEETTRFAIDLENAPANSLTRTGNWSGTGQIYAVVWFDAGELLTIASVSEQGRYRRNGMHSTYGISSHSVAFQLEIEPFRTDLEWYGIDSQGKGSADWSAPSNFDRDSINLIGWAPPIKIDEYLENFRKAFNLKLTQPSPGVFSLDVKNKNNVLTYGGLDLDNLAGLEDRENSDLGLPGAYKIGFTTNADEQGYQESGGYEGGGSISTGANDSRTIEQKSSFSYNWFKTLAKVEDGGQIPIRVPVVSKAEVWSGENLYRDDMAKRFTDLGLRFWYRDGILPGTYYINNWDLKLAQVSNELAGVVKLTYDEKDPDSLANVFFTIISGRSHYTELEVTLSPEQFAALRDSALVKYNGDLYQVAEVQGFDPSGRNKTRFKLIAL